MASAQPPQLTPVQKQTLDVLGTTGAPRREFDPNLGRDLRSQLEAAMVEVLEDMSPNEVLFLSKHRLAQVHGCEVRFIAEEAAAGDFEATIPMVKGTIAHKAIELGIHWKGEPLPLELVDEAISSLTLSDSWVSDFLQTCSEADQATLRSEAGDKVHKFFECFPPLKPVWRPATESSLSLELAQGRVKMRGKVDLTLGAATGNEARKVIIDLKTGNPNPTHRDDLRFYALIETIRIGVPPRLIASFYLDQGVSHTEVVTESVLESALLRCIEGARRITSLQAGTSAPLLRPSPVCKWCIALEGCDTGQKWLEDPTF
ncbi:MAG: PD-(D/E)XK nuclease family protein [Acidimicrobiales bacterium]|nr:PD-(D/E)XK nuclease family protein [Acidimicrobiales bacterium]